MTTSEMESMRVAKALRDARSAKRVTQEWVSEAADVSLPTVKRAEGRGNVGCESLRAICSVLDLDADDILARARTAADPGTDGWRPFGPIRQKAADVLAPDIILLLLVLAAAMLVDVVVVEQAKRALSALARADGVATGSTWAAWLARWRLAGHLDPREIEGLCTGGLYIGMPLLTLALFASKSWTFVRGAGVTVSGAAPSLSMRVSAGVGAFLMSVSGTVGAVSSIRMPYLPPDILSDPKAFPEAPWVYAGGTTLVLGMIIMCLSLRSCDIAWRAAKAAFAARVPTLLAEMRTVACGGPGIDFDALVGLLREAQALAFAAGRPNDVLALQYLVEDVALGISGRKGLAEYLDVAAAACAERPVVRRSKDNPIPRETRVAMAEREERRRLNVEEAVCDLRRRVRMLA